MYIDYKQTVWERAHFKGFSRDEAIAEMENGGFPDIDEYESVGSIEEMTVKDNEDNATVELYDDNGKLIWDNKHGKI